MDFLLAKVRGKFHRLINSRYPPVGFFDHYTDDTQELAIAFELENLTNPRLNVTLGALKMLPEDGIIMGVNTANVAMAAFIHTQPQGSRFNTPQLGAWYGSHHINTAIEETVYHNDKRIRHSKAKFPIRMQLREYITSTAVDLIDIRGQQGTHPELYDPNNYKSSQAFGDQHRWPFGNPSYEGIVFDSVRHKGGINVCIYRPKALNLPIVQGAHYQYYWKHGGQITVSKY